MEKYLGDLCFMDNFYIRNIHDTGIKTDKDFVKGEAVIFGMHLGGTMEYSETSFSVNKDCIAITPKDEQEILLKYIYYYLLANKKVWKRYYVGTSLKNLSKIDLQFVKINYPSIELQYHIVAIFDLLHESLKKRAETRFYLYKFLPSYYQYLEKATGRYWTKKIKIEKALMEFEKEDKGMAELGSLLLPPFHKGFKVILSHNVYSIAINKKVCNPYYLAVALSSSPKIALAIDKCNGSNLGISFFISKISEISLTLPDMGVQKEFEKRYKQIESLEESMFQFIQQTELLIKVLLFKLLSRNSEKSIWKNNEMQDVSSAIETEKFTYEDYRKLTRLSEYDEKRDYLFELLEKGALIQYFDEKEGIIKFREAHLQK